MHAASFYIQSLAMQPHPEGGYFAETYRSEETISRAALPQRFAGDRSFCTAIYFLLEAHQMSALHRIQADEIWHFYAGSPLDIFVIWLTGELTVIRLGNNLAQGEVFQAVVPAGCWFGSKPAVDAAAVDAPTMNATTKNSRFSLVGCTVAPGFDFADFEMADQATLLAQFPQHQDVIDMLSKR